MNEKVLIIADPHAGVRSDSDTFLNAFEKLFSEFIPKVLEQEQTVSNIFFLGDLFDNRNTLNVKTCNWVIEAFENFCFKYPNIKITLLTGNHDIYYRNTKEISSLKILKSIPNIEIISEYKSIILSNRKIVLCPWTTESEEHNTLFKEKADICFGHFEINGFELVEGYVEKHGTSPNRFKENFMLTFSGHFHIRSEKENIIYVGSPYETRWSDCGNSKGLYVLDLNTLNYRFIENTAASKHKKIFLSLLKKDSSKLKEDVTNNFVSLILDENIDSRELDRLNFLLSSLKPLSFNVIEAEKDYKQTDDLGEVSSPIEYLIEYINSIEFSNNIDKNILIRKINTLYTEMERNTL